MTTFGDTELLTAAYPLTRRYHCPFYDAVYLALAERTNRSLAVADDRFYRHVRGHPLVVWIAGSVP